MPSHADMSLGVILVEAKLLKKEDLDRAGRLQESLEDRGDKRGLHAILAAEGIVDLRILKRAMSQHNRDTLRCPDCGKAVITKDQAAFHARNHAEATEVPEEWFQYCDACKRKQQAARFPAVPAMALE